MRNIIKRILYQPDIPLDPDELFKTCEIFFTYKVHGSSSKWLKNFEKFKLENQAWLIIYAFYHGLDKTNKHIQSNIVTDDNIGVAIESVVPLINTPKKLLKFIIENYD